MVIDTKVEDFRYKARFVARSHMTKAPATITNVSVVTRETIRIALMITTLNPELNLVSILNAYVQVQLTEKVLATLGLEFGRDAGKIVVNIRTLCGLTPEGAAFRSHIARCMESVRESSCAKGSL